MDLSEKAGKINEILKKYLPPIPEDKKYEADNESKVASIEEVMEYSVMSGGKRLRGIMLLEAFRLYSLDKDIEKELAEPFAAAIECIHAYSLVHDDLPSMDNDMYRRGKLTTHAKYGHAFGVLAGDALLNYAFEIMSQAALGLTKVRGEMAGELFVRACRAMSAIVTRSGYSGMIGGQVMDVYPEAASSGNTATAGTIADPDEKARKIDRLYRIYELKTSRLFQAALCAGAILAGAEKEQIADMEEIGYCIGEAFQIKDDILDKNASFEELGKDIGSDEKNDKTTSVTLLGVNEAEEASEQFLDRAVTLLGKQPGNKDFFRDLTQFLKVRRK